MTNDNNPWGSHRPDGPPDLDELLRKWQTKLGNILHKPANKGPSSGPGNTDKKQFSISTIAGFLLLAVFIAWAISGIYIVSAAEQGVITRFGKYAGTTNPGPHWFPRVIDAVDVINVQQVYTFPYQAEMLTKDENIVSVALNVQYRIDNPRNYLFNVREPIASLQQATASALRQVIGHSTLDNVLTSGRQLVREQVTQQLHEILDNYKTGLVVTDVALQSVKPPEQVTAAFDDAIKAREDENRYINQANAYAQRVQPAAVGKAARLLAEADAYKQQIILNAQANTAGYLALLPQYTKAPLVLRERLYLDAVESMLSKSTNILIDTNSNNMLYLPLDQLMKMRASVLSKMPEEQTAVQQGAVQ